MYRANDVPTHEIMKDIFELRNKIAVLKRRRNGYLKIGGTMGLLYLQYCENEISLRQRFVGELLFILEERKRADEKNISRG